VTRERQTSALSVPKGTNAPQLLPKRPVLEEKSALRALQELLQAVVPITKIVSTFQQFAPMGSTGPDQPALPVRKIKLVFLEEPPKRSPQAIIHQQESTLNSCAREVTTVQMLMQWLNVRMVTSVKKAQQL